MRLWHPTTRQYRLLALATVALIAAGVGAAALPTPADAQADLTVGSLEVADANSTADANVSDVTLATNLEYAHTVPDAERRIITLKVGPSTDALETIAYQQTRDPPGDASGSVALSGSVFEHSSWTADDWNPAYADTTSREVVVRAVIEVRRASGSAVRHTVTDTATVTITDGGSVTVDLGGTGEFTVST